MTRWAEQHPCSKQDVDANRFTVYPVKSARLYLWVLSYTSGHSLPRVVVGPHASVTGAVCAAADYPFKAPTVRFETACFHPNVDQYGNICLDILKVRTSACA